MYDELVKRLRGIHPEEYDDEWEFAYDCQRAMNEAADAIEELSKLADAIPHICECCVGCELEKKNWGCNHAFVLSPKRAMEYLSKPKEE